LDAIALLKADHKTVESLFRRFEQAGPNETKLKRKLVDQKDAVRTASRKVRELASPNPRKRRGGKRAPRPQDTVRIQDLEAGSSYLM
jgi:hypothetical protein